MAIKPIEIIIRLKDEFSSMLGSTQAKLAAVAGAVAGFFGITLFAGAVKSAAEFEAALSRVKAATGATSEEMTLLKHAAEEAGANTKYTSVEAAEALENLAKAGLDAKSAIAALPAVLSLAQAGDVGLGESAEFVTKAVMGMGLAFTDAGRVADVLAMGANASNTSVKGLAEALSYAAPVAASLGLGLETTVAIIGKFADAGIDASRAGTALNSVLSQFSDPASKFREQLNAIGITTSDFEVALRQLAAAGPRGASAIQAVGQEAGPALRALLNQGIGALDDLKSKLDESAGSAARTAAIMEDNLPGAMNGLSSAWDTVKSVLGTPVLPVLTDGVNEFAAALRGAVSDGTVAKFGEAIAEAFGSALKWVRDFVAQVDFKAVAASMQSFATLAGEIFTKIGEYASTAGNTVKLAYGVMSAGVNTVLAAIYGIGSVFAEVASTVMAGVAKLREGMASITFGGLSERYQAAADAARNAAQGFGEAAQAMRDKAAASMVDAAESAQMAREGFVGLAGATDKVADSSAKTESTVKELSNTMTAAGEVAEAAGQKQAKAATDAGAAVAEQRAKVAQLRAEYEKQMSLGNLQAAAEVLLKIDQAQKGVAASAALSSKQIEALATSMAAKNKVAQAGLNLELAQERASEATARAAGNEAGVIQSKIRQKEIEIKIIQASVKAMNDEADASIRVAQAKLAEARSSKDGLSPELEAELLNRIELAKAKKLEAQAAEAGIETMRAEITMLRNGTDERRRHNDATRDSASARDEATAALERENSAQERAIAAAEKAIELREREAELERKRLGIDRDGFSVNSNGERVVTEAETRESLYEKARSSGLTAQQADRISKQFIDERGQAAGYASYAQQAGESWSVIVQREIQKLARSNDLAESSGSSGSSSGIKQTVNHVVTFKSNGKSSSVNVAGAEDVATLKKLLDDLTDGKDRS